MATLLDYAFMPLIFSINSYKHVYYVAPFGTEVTYSGFGTIFGKYMNESTLTVHQYSQNSMGRSEN